MKMMVIVEENRNISSHPMEQLIWLLKVITAMIQRVENCTFLWCLLLFGAVWYCSCKHIFLRCWSYAYVSCCCSSYIRICIDFIQLFSTYLGPTPFAASHCKSILHSFLLFTQPIEQYVVKMTNLYGTQTMKDQWINVDDVEMHMSWWNPNSCNDRQIRTVKMPLDYFDQFNHQNPAHQSDQTHREDQAHRVNQHQKNHHLSHRPKNQRPEHVEHTAITALVAPNMQTPAMNVATQCVQHIWHQFYVICAEKNNLYPNN